MDELELIFELDDRHEMSLVYEGEYRLKIVAKELYAPFKTMFNDWRQRIYRFENNLGASVVLYSPLTNGKLRWDFVTARFVGDDPFDFAYTDGINSGLSWREVQQKLDRVKTGWGQV